MLKFKKKHEIKNFWNGIRIQTSNLLMDEKLMYGVDYIFVVDPYVVIQSETYPIYFDNVPINTDDLKFVKYEFIDTNGLIMHPFVQAHVKKCINLSDRTLIVATVTTTDYYGSDRTVNELHDAIVNEKYPLDINIKSDEVTMSLMFNGSTIKPPINTVPYNIITRDINKAIMPFWLTDENVEECEEHFEDIKFLEKFKSKTLNYVEEIEKLAKEYKETDIAESVNSEEFEKFFDEIQTRLSLIIDVPSNAANDVSDTIIGENDNNTSSNPEHDEFVSNINNSVKDKLDDSDDSDKNTLESNE